MKGIILAGGLGSRLQPLTTITNKHLLPVYDRPMVWFAIETLVAAGIADILLVTGGEHAGDFLRLLENGEAFGCGLRYAYQRGEGGIAAALALARDFAAGSPLAVLLGDNLFEHGVAAAAAEFARQPRGARLLLKQVPDPERFGVPAFDPAGRILRIEEKPARPASEFAVTGCYFYDDSVFDKIARCRPSGRRELEITDVNNLYLAEGALEYSLVEGWWCDAGTFDSLHRASGLIERQRRAAPAPEPENNPDAPRRRAGPRGLKEAAEQKRDARHRRTEARAMERPRAKEVSGAPAWGTGPPSPGEHKRDARHHRAEARTKEGPRAKEVSGAPAWGTRPTSRGEHKRDAQHHRAEARTKEGPRAKEVSGAPAWGTGPTSRGEHKRDAPHHRAAARAKEVSGAPSWGTELPSPGEHKRDPQHRRAEARAMEVSGAPAWGTGPTSRGEHKRDPRHSRAAARAKK